MPTEAANRGILRQFSMRCVGLRNSTMLSQAPTRSTQRLAGVSGPHVMMMMMIMVMVHNPKAGRKSSHSCLKKGARRRLE